MKPRIKTLGRERMGFYMPHEKELTVNYVKLDPPFGYFKIYFEIT